MSSIEESLAVAVAAQVEPLRAEIRALRESIEALRRSLPPMVVSAPEAARRLGVSLSTVKRRIRDGSLPVRRIGRLLRVDLTAIHGPTDAEVNALAVSLRQDPPHDPKANS